MNIDLGLSIAGPAFRFGPEFLFLSGEDGTATGNPFEAFTDTGGTTAADFGDAIARINDRSPNARNALQSSSALRPLLGRAPVDVRNIIPRSFGSAGWTSFGNSVAADSATDFDAAGDPFVVVTAGGESDDNSFSQLSFNLEDGVPVRVRARYRKGTSDQFGVHFRRGGGGAGTARVYVVWGASGPEITSQGSDAVSPSLDIISPTEVVISFGFVTEGAASNYGIRTYAGGATNPEFMATAPPANPGGTTLVSELQVVAGSTTEDTPYQRVASALDITETGFPSPAFIRPDLSDDVLPTEFPDGFTGDVMVFGRKGSWIERGVEIASAGSLNIGPETFTGAPPGVLAALGDIVGWVAVERTLTDFEVARLVQYHRARGARGLLVPGPELLTNPDFSDGETGWTTSGGWEISGGAAFVATPDGIGVLAQLGAADFDRTYLLQADVTEISAGVVRLRLGGGTGVDGPQFGTAQNAKFVALSGDNDRFQLVTNTSFIGSVDSVSLRELRPEEDW